MFVISYIVLLNLIIIKIDALEMDVKNFWPEFADDLTQITWSHATNSMEKLEDVFIKKIMMIETDVSIGLNGEIIMAHPPDKISDLTFNHLLKRVIKARKDGLRVGLKLDYKDIEAVKPSLHLLSSTSDEIDFPLMINADILEKEGASAQYLDPNLFLSLTQQILTPYLSPLWSLGYTTPQQGKYTQQDFSEMLQLIINFKIEQGLTLPLRASLLANSKQEVIQFLDKAPFDTTITIWSGKTDTVCVENLVQAVQHIGVHRIYLDVPSELEEKIRENLAQGSFPSSTITKISRSLDYFLNVLYCVF